MRRQTKFFKNGIFHLYNRGVNKGLIFHDDKDKNRFMSRVSKYALEYGIQAVSYCLMPNHYHLLMQQLLKKVNISNFMQALGTSYAMYYNKKYRRLGPLFQSRFRAKTITNPIYLQYVSRYIHNNPRELYKGNSATQQVEFIRNYKWSSYREYINQSEETSNWLNCNLVLSYYRKGGAGKRQALRQYMEFVERAPASKDEEFISFTD